MYDAIKYNVPDDKGKGYKVKVGKVKLEGSLSSFEEVQAAKGDNRVSESGISIQDAKELLSIRYDLAVDNIEIILKG